MKMNRWMPFVMIGFLILVMVGGMIMFSWMFAEMNPPAAMLPGNGNTGSGMWRVMLIPLLGLLGMVGLMFFFFRRMTGRMGRLSMMKGGRQDGQIQSVENDLTVLTFGLPDVNCAHCKMKIEQEVSSLPGVASVNVDIEAKQAVIQLISPPTKAEIKALLSDIGYPPES
jgi:copper chaperone CopZ